MMKLAVPFSVLAVALAGCGMFGMEREERAMGRAPATAGPVAAPAAQQAPYITGTGVVQSVNPAPAPLASAGATGTQRGAAPAPVNPLYRLGIRMNDGRVQYIDTPSAEFKVGDRVALEAGNVIRKL